jgi:superfamily I DNA/RNA helicase
VDGLENETEEQDRQPEIRLTTHNGSKGMSAGFTFIVGLENEVLPRTPDRISDNEICQFVVALTRTRQQCHLISTGFFAGVKRNASDFLAWIPPEHISRVRVDKNFF